MSAVDFETWAAPDLVITLGGRTYQVPPPSVDDAKKILAAAVRGEVNLRIVNGSIPDGVQRVLDTISSDEHPALRDAYGQMVADGQLPIAIDRAAYYAIFFWARGKEYADALAAALWTPRGDRGEAGGAPPKG